MYIPNDDTQNYPFFKLHFVVETFASNKETNQNSISPKGCQANEKANVIKRLWGLV